VSHEVVLVSACLLGKKCRYDGSSNPSDQLSALTGDREVVAVCPEEMGGLGTPRLAACLDGKAADIIAGKGQVVDCSGGDVTEAFLNGARKTTAITKTHHVTLAILKERSPSCGVYQVYEKGILVEGRGVTTEMLVRQGIPILAMDPPKQ
tara:strand:- start:1304 stop:1753 length:450 start_codon:yes stop_codon:yes gene_type:complete